MSVAGVVKPPGPRPKRASAEKAHDDNKPTPEKIAKKDLQEAEHTHSLVEEPDPSPESKRISPSPPKNSDPKLHHLNPPGGRIYNVAVPVEDSMERAES